MATVKTLLDFAKNALTLQDSNAVRGGKSYVPTDSGSVGYINWDDVTIREGLDASPSQTLNTGFVNKRK